MARAKRFDRDRAEARRRYRAALAGNADLEAGEEGLDEAGAGGLTAGSAASAAAAQTGRRATARPAGDRPGVQSPRARMGILQAARAAYRVVNIRQDLRQLPRIISHRSLWIPVLLSLGSTILIVLTGPTNTISSFAFNVFGLPPAMASVFIAGFFAPTAGWMAGGIVGLAAAILYSLFLLIASQGAVPDFPSGTGQQVTDSVVSAFVIGPMYGIVLGAAAAWYKRWLHLSSPARTSRPGTSGRNARGNARSTRGR